MLYPMYPDTAPEVSGDYMVSGLFQDKASAEAALTALEKNGYRKEEISVAMTGEDKGPQGFGIREATHAPEGAAWGGLFGGLGGALIAWFMVIGTLPSAGLDMAAAGALLGTLAGFGAGAIAGGLIGGLVGLGIPKDEIDLYRDYPKLGHMLIAVKTKGLSEAKIVDNIFQAGNAMNTHKQWQAFTKEDEAAASTMH